MNKNQDGEFELEDLASCSIKELPYSTIACTNDHDKYNQLYVYAKHAVNNLAKLSEECGEAISPEHVTFYEMRIPGKRNWYGKRAFAKLLWTTPQSLGLPVHYQLKQAFDSELLEGVPVISDETHQRLYNFLEICKANQEQIKSKEVRISNLAKKSFGDANNLVSLILSLEKSRLAAA